MSQRGWHVLESVHADDGAYCVDFFVDEDGGFGYAHFRADPEDQGGWTMIVRSLEPFASERQAAIHAGRSIGWLTTLPTASRALQRWLEASDV